MKATKVGHRWRIIDGKDSVTVWLDENGFHSQRVSDCTGEARGHEQPSLSHDDLILAAEGQLPLI